jgi:ABC-2 type transport system ATP-binding protein
MEQKPDFAIVTKNLSKNFGSTDAVVSLSLAIPKGKIYTLIGPNGAGKTTLLKMLVGLLTPEKGSITIQGFDSKTHSLEAKKQFSYIPDDPSGYEFLSGREFLGFSARVLGISEKDLTKRIEELLPLFPIKDVIDQRIADYSRGNKEKIIFLASLLRNPSILIIDEPLVGLDPKSISIFGKKLREFARSGGTVLLTTHILPFAKQYADIVGILSKGKLVHEINVTNENLDTLYEKYTDTTVE